MQRHGSKGSVTSITSSSRGGEKRIQPTHMIIQREKNNQMLLLPLTHLVNSSATGVKLNKSATFKTDLKTRKQERGRIVQLGNKDECTEQLQVFEMIAEVDLRDTGDDGDDEQIDEAKEQAFCAEKSKGISKQQHHSNTQQNMKKHIPSNEHASSKTGMEKPSQMSKRVDNKSNPMRSSTSIKKPTGVVEQKSNVNSKYPHNNDDESDSDEDDSPLVPLRSSSSKMTLSNRLINSPVSVTNKPKVNSVSQKTHSVYGDESETSCKSQISIGPQHRKTTNSVGRDTMVLNCSSPEQEKDQDVEQKQQQHQLQMNNDDIVCRYEILSKKCNKLTKENAALQLEHDRLLKEIQILKKNTMPIPDAAGRQWFINMGRYFSNKGPDGDIIKHADALGIDDPRDLVGCIQDTTSNTARQVVRYLYSEEKLLSMTGPEIPQVQRQAIRQFAESQKGPISNHQFNEAINGVFRSKKNEFKSKQQGNVSFELACVDKTNKQIECTDTAQRTLDQMLKKKKKTPQSANDALLEKENDDVGDEN